MSTAVQARYDWISVTCGYDPAELIAEFSKRMGAEPRDMRALNGYSRAVGLFRGDEPEVRVQWSADGDPNVLSTGYPSQLAYEILADRFPEYRVARADIAIDFDDKDWFEVAHGAMRRLSHERGIKHHIRGDWETPGSPDGRTTYSGALGKSAVVRRLYEFSKCHGYGLPVRYEIEIKPPSKAKHRYACMSPLFMIQSDSYSVELLRRLGFSIDRVRVDRGVAPVRQKAWFSHLVRQYGPKLMEFIEGELEGKQDLLGAAIQSAYQAELDHRRKCAELAKHASETDRAF